MCWLRCHHQPHRHWIYSEISTGGWNPSAAILMGWINTFEFSRCWFLHLQHSWGLCHQHWHPATLDFLVPSWNLFRFSGGPGSAGGTGWSSGHFPTLVFPWFSSQNVPLSSQLLQAPDRGPGRCLQQSLWGCRSKSKVSAQHQVSDLCLLMVHHWNSQKTPPCSPCNNTKQLKKERFLLWWRNFPPRVSLVLLMNMRWVTKPGCSRSCSITVFESRGSFRSPLEILWGEKLQVLELHLRELLLRELLLKAFHFLRELWPFSDAFQSQTCFETKDGQWNLSFGDKNWSCLDVKQCIHLKCTINIHSFQKGS